MLKAIFCPVIDSRLLIIPILIINFESMKFSTEELIEGIRSGNKRLIAKAITLVESKKAEHRVQAEELLKKIMPFTGHSVRVGVTGVPGAGKSTFIESFGRLAIAQGKK